MYWGHGFLPRINTCPCEADDRQTALKVKESKTSLKRCGSVD